MNDDAAVEALFAGEPWVCTPQPSLHAEPQPNPEQRAARRCKAQSAAGIAPVVCARQVKVRCNRVVPAHDTARN